MDDVPRGRDDAPLEPLIGVIGVGENRTLGPITVTIYSVERYATGFRVVTGIVVRREHPIAAAMAAEFALASETDRSVVEGEAKGGWVGYAPHRSERLVWSARDDLGTAYETFMGGGHGGGMPDQAWRMEYEFRPGIPPDARRLTLEATDLRWYEYDHMGRHSQLVRTDSGPWTFDIEVAAIHHP